jgi:hypothetical protein
MFYFKGTLATLPTSLATGSHSYSHHFHLSFTDQPHAHFIFTAFFSRMWISRGNTRGKLQLLVKLPKDEFRSNQQPWS